MSFNTPQDIPEILSYIFNELATTSIMALETIKISVQSSTSCLACLSERNSEHSTFILQLPMSRSVQRSIDLYLAAEPLQSNTMCCSGTQVLTSNKIHSCGRYLIIQLNRFMTDSDGACVKDVRKIDVPVDKLDLPISVDSDVPYTKSFI